MLVALSLQNQIDTDYAKIDCLAVEELPTLDYLRMVQQVYSSFLSCYEYF